MWLRFYLHSGSLQNTHHGLSVAVWTPSTLHWVNVSWAGYSPADSVCTAGNEIMSTLSMFSLVLFWILAGEVGPFTSEMTNSKCCVCFQNSAVFIEMLVSFKNLWIILYEQWIWSHQTSGLLQLHLWRPEQLFQARTRTFLDPIQVFFLPKPNQTVSTVLPQQKIKKLNQKKCKRGRTRLLSMRLTETHLHIDDEVTL